MKREAPSGARFGDCDWPELGRSLYIREVRTGTYWQAIRIRRHHEAVVAVLRQACGHPAGQVAKYLVNRAEELPLANTSPVIVTTSWNSGKDNRSMFTDSLFSTSIALHESLEWTYSCNRYTGASAM